MTLLTSALLIWVSERKLLPTMVAFNTLWIGLSSVVIVRNLFNMPFLQGISFQNNSIRLRSARFVAFNACFYEKSHHELYFWNDETRHQMTTLNHYGRWLVVAPLMLFAALVWDVRLAFLTLNRPLKSSLFAALRLMHRAERVCVTF